MGINKKKTKTRTLRYLLDNSNNKNIDANITGESQTTIVADSLSSTLGVSGGGGGGGMSTSATARAGGAGAAGVIIIWEYS